MADCFSRALETIYYIFRLFFITPVDYNRIGEIACRPGMSQKGQDHVAMDKVLIGKLFRTSLRHLNRKKAVQRQMRD